MTEQEIESVRLIAKEEFNNQIVMHLGLCPFTKLEIEKRLRTIENRFVALVGFMLGSGLLGGAVGGSIVAAVFGK